MTAVLMEKTKNQKSQFNDQGFEFRKYIFDAQYDYMNLPIKNRTFDVAYGSEFLLYLPFIISKAELKKGYCV